jgi:magnesium-transporting ATPase (P-type)
VSGIASASGGAHLTAMSQKSPLDDPESAAFAWARWKRMMGLMGALTAVTVVAVLVYLWATVTEMSIHFYIATGLGVGLSMLLMSALMGLVFMSNGTGHDESVSDRRDYPD